METNSSFMASASRWAASSTRTSSLLGCGGDPPLTLGSRCNSERTMPSNWERLAPICSKSGAITPSLSFKQGFQQMERLDLRMALVGGQRLRVGDCLLAFDRQFFEAKWHDAGPLSLA